MADKEIELVIKIDDNYLKKIKWCVEDGNIDYEPWVAIANGIPLPKGHGRLIDADTLNKKMEEREEKLQDDRSMWESSAVATALDMFAPTIIEADKESEEKK